MNSIELTELALRARGNEAALNELIACVVQYVTGWVWNRVGQKYPDDVDDISQEILIAIVKGIPAFEGRSSFARWCGRIMSNRLGDFFRRRYRQERRNRIPRADVDDSGSYEMELWFESLEADCAILLDGCPAHYKEVIIRHYLDDESFVSIAESEGVSWDMIRGRCRRGIAWLREHNKEIQ